MNQTADLPPIALEKLPRIIAAVCDAAIDADAVEHEIVEVLERHCAYLRGQIEAAQPAHSRAENE